MISLSSLSVVPRSLRSLIRFTFAFIAFVHTEIKSFLVVPYKLDKGKVMKKEWCNLIGSSPLMAMFFYGFP